MCMVYDLIAPGHIEVCLAVFLYVSYQIIYTKFASVSRIRKWI